jgi:rare lipoprotein A
MFKIFTVAAATLLLAACNTIADAGAGKKEVMVASWYMHGTRTANGEKFNPDGMTVAHKTLPFHTKLRLTHGDKSVIVRVNDRGPFIKGRHIDLSRGVARQLGCLSSGICKVEAERLYDDGKPTRQSGREL